MPRPTRARTSLPGHSRAAKLKPDSAGVTAPDGLDDSYMMAPEEMAPIAAVKAAAALSEPALQAAQESAFDAEEDETLREPKTKQTKAEKAYNKRKLLLDKLNASTTPYSKSHNRRLRRAARPQDNLVTTLQEVEAVLPSIEPAFDMPDEDEFVYEAEGGEGEEEATAAPGGPKAKTGGKGKEKLTAKKRQRVLTAESTRLPAIIKNESFAASPFATIRQHTLNTLAMQKNPSLPKKAK
ncbi:hypothetical protein BMF94_3201 [Rhodotorula taiwanensis]|uniref:Ribosome biogenesis protein SLX9 n=1 Tax=Rhodotorula taiwanensis TaxID=741276 RepID=A0A2S5BA73_9BASI|nr:hypothetical protein BMF94_3201 [Rhodotorula taiwanensis]